jgi:hypothetical protein
MCGQAAFVTYGDSMHTPLHNAMPANWFYQIAGTKKWKIYNPKHWVYLQPRTLANNVVSFSGDYDTASESGPRYLVT